jgi:arylsulfatase A-like enzyme
MIGLIRVSLAVSATSWIGRQPRRFILHPGIPVHVPPPVSLLTVRLHPLTHSTRHPWRHPNRRARLLAPLLSGLLACGSGETAGTAPVGDVPNRSPTGAVIIQGDARVGSVLVATNTLADADGLGTLAYQWRRDTLAIAGATRDRYTVQSIDVGASLSVRVSYQDGRNTPEVVSSGGTVPVVSGGPIDAAHPNILLIISDDQGIDASNQYAQSADRPHTPTLDSLATAGVVFDNVWATPACTTTRGTMITGRHGVNSGLTFVPAVMSTSTETLPRYLRANASTSMYRTAVIGKWHLGGSNPATSHPTDSGVDYYAGNLTGVLPDYFSWPLVENGQSSTSTRYHTTHLTDLAIDWVAQQQHPWLLWLAYAAPHSPFHLPPATLHSRPGLSGTAADISARPREYFLAAIEAMDSEIGRLLAALPAEVRANALVLFLGDNGTPAPVVDRSVFAGNHSKNSLYEGGIRVPMVAAGAGVTRRNSREAALINTTDVFVTVANVAGSATTSVYDSYSFAPLLRESGAGSRPFNYSEFQSDAVDGWTVRNARYKLIQFVTGEQQLYDLSADLAERSNLLTTGGDFASVVNTLKAEGDRIRGALRAP